jgi:O-antigen/teichoic acid export membrane protein
MKIRGFRTGASMTSPFWSRNSSSAASSGALSTDVPAAAAPGLGLIGRFGWGLADQLLSSATNFLLGLFVARTVGLRDLGAFSIAYATFTLSVGAVRALAGELLVVRHSAVAESEWRAGVRGAAGTALMVGIVVALGCFVAGARVGGSFATVLGIFGASLPFLLMQDVWRFAFFARGNGSAAFLNDAAWAVAMFATFPVLHYFDAFSVAVVTLAWAGAGLVAALVGVFQLRILPSGPATSARWLWHHRDLGARFLAEFAVGGGVTGLNLFAIGRVAGLSELGRLRVGEIALGPLNVLFAGVGLVATPEGVRLLHESRRRFVRGCAWLSLVMVVGVMAWGVVVLFMPSRVGELVLGMNWDDARSLLLPLLIWSTAWGSSFGAWTGLRSLAAAKRSLRTKCIDAIFTLSFGLVGAYVAGAEGVAWGNAGSGCVKSLHVWWQFSRALREHQLHSSAERVATRRGALADGALPAPSSPARQ